MFSNKSSNKYFKDDDCSLNTGWLVNHQLAKLFNAYLARLAKVEEVTCQYQDSWEDAHTFFEWKKWIERVEALTTTTTLSGEGVEDEEKRDPSNKGQSIIDM